MLSFLRALVHHRGASISITTAFDLLLPAVSIALVAATVYLSGERGHA